MINKMCLELLAKGSILRAQKRYAGRGSLSPAFGTPPTPMDSFSGSKIASHSITDQIYLELFATSSMLRAQKKYAGGGRQIQRFQDSIA
jgi:hypothetical protein